MFGYLDPGAGSSIAAVLASGAVGVGVALRVARQRLGNKLRRGEPADVDVHHADLDAERA